MNELINLWNIILKSNTFNFIVLVVILAIVMQKLHISDALEKLKTEIVEKIEKSKKAKSDAIICLSDAKSKTENLDAEISEKISLANSQAHNVGEMIHETAQRKIKQITDNIEKVIKAEEKTIAIKLNDQTAQASIRLAEDIIRKQLQQDPSLHDRYINESLEELEKAAL